MKSLRSNSRGAMGTKTVVIIVLLSIFTIFILQNTAVVEIRLLFWQISLSRVVLLLGSLFIGVLIGLLIGWEVSGPQRRSQGIKKGP